MLGHAEGLVANVLQQCGFTTTIRSNQSITSPRRNLQFGILEEVTTSGRDGEVLDEDVVALDLRLFRILLLGDGEVAFKNIDFIIQSCPV